MPTIDLLARTTTLGSLNRERLADLAGASTQRTLRRGETLFEAGQIPDSMLIVQKGLVKLVRRTNGGRAICGLYGATESIGDLAVVRGMAYPADAIAASDSVIVTCVPRDRLLEAFAEEPKLFLSLACAIEENVTSLFDKIDVLSAGGVEARLATLLLKLNDRFGDDFDDGTSEIPVALSRRDLAELVATSFETAIRIMSRWEREGLLETTRRGFTLHDVHRLSSLSGAAALAAE